MRVHRDADVLRRSAILEREDDFGDELRYVWPDHALADGRAAFERLASGEQFGKVVIRVS